MTGAALVALLKGFRFTGVVTEKDFQDAVGEALTTRGVAFEREVDLGDGDRIDFMVGEVGLELKMEGSTANVARQLQRYCRHERVQEIVLATTRTLHQAVLGRQPSFGGKALHVTRVRGGLL